MKEMTMRDRLGLASLLLLGLWLAGPQDAQASCEVHTTTPTYADLTFLGVDLCDANGNKLVTTGTSGDMGTATAAAPTLAEGAAAGFSFDLAGNARFTLGTLISGEDQANNLLMTSGGVGRQIIMFGGPAVAATDATWPVQLVSVNMKTFHAIETCTGTCTQTIKIYGTSTNSAVAGTSQELCTLTLNNATTATASCNVTSTWAYYFAITSGSGGTTPLSTLYVNF